MRIGIYNPEFPQNDDQISDSVKKEEELDIQELEKKSPVLKFLNNSENPLPLTKEEADLIQEETDTIQEAISITLDKIKTLQEEIDLKVSQSDFGFTVSIADNTMAKKAVRRAFGSRKSAITYEMYKMALRAKQELEKTEGKEFLNQEK